MMRLVLDRVEPWRHELAGCLHACAATLLAHAGVDPLEALGAGWRFHYRPGDARREEYYYPCPPGESLLASLAPFHPVRSSWHQPAGIQDGWAAVRARVASGQPVAVAVDNYHLPFRPAFCDVHSNHLVIVYGYDDGAGTVRVLDAVPPHFDGDLPRERLDAARGSHNPARHERDRFFTLNPIASRWLEAEIDPGSAPAFCLEHVRDVLASNLRGFIEPPTAPDGHLDGLAGQRAFLEGMAARMAAGEHVADELFIVAGTILATTALHADWLAMAGRRLERPELVELGRLVERVAHHWPAVRILAARSGDRPSERPAGAGGQAGGAGLRSAERLSSRARRLLDDTEHALDEMATVLAGLEATGPAG